MTGSHSPQKNYVAATASKDGQGADNIVAVHQLVAKRSVRVTFLVLAPLLSVLSIIVLSASFCNVANSSRETASFIRQALFTSSKFKDFFANSELAPVGERRIASLPPRQRVSAVLLFDKEPNNFGHSLFLTGATSRFGTGRLDYRAVDVDTREPGNANWTSQPAEPDVVPEEPCLLVTSRPEAAFPWRQSHAPHCRVFLIKDEFCNASDTSPTSVPVDFRQYDIATTGTSESGRGVYVPLGPRIDFFEALLSVVSETVENNGPDAIHPLDHFRTLPAHLPKSSDRKKVFNAVFSRDTSASRESLAALLESPEMRQTGLTAPGKSTVQIAAAWSKNLSAGQMTPNEYVDVLRNSVFTLAPVGHNPESYRLFEAAESGSIPVVALDQEYESHSCKDSLQLMRKSAPRAIVWLNSWDDLPDTLERLIGDETRLNEMQRELRLWYEAFMTSRIRSFETNFIGGDGITDTP